MFKALSNCTVCHYLINITVEWYRSNLVLVYRIMFFQSVLHNYLYELIIKTFWSSKLCLSGLSCSITLTLLLIISARVFFVCQWNYFYSWESRFRFQIPAILILYFSVVAKYVTRVGKNRNSYNLWKRKKIQKL